jgi:uncharacterized membrane protein YphA (DoxX/SURF4 family)
MSTTVSPAKATTASPATRRRGQSIVLWFLQALLAVMFASAAFQKLAGTHYMVVMFTKIGAGQWLRYLVGTLEVAGAAAVLIALLSGLAALGLTALMVGATVTNVFIIGCSPWVPIGFALVSALVAWGRWPQAKALPGRLRRRPGRAATGPLLGSAPMTARARHYDQRLPGGTS